MPLIPTSNHFANRPSVFNGFTGLLTFLYLLMNFDYFQPLHLGISTDLTFECLFIINVLCLPTFYHYRRMSAYLLLLIMNTYICFTTTEERLPTFYYYGGLLSFQGIPIYLIMVDVLCGAVVCEAPPSNASKGDGTRLAKLKVHYLYNIVQT